MKVHGMKSFFVVLLVILIFFVAAGVHKISFARLDLVPVEGIEEMLPTRRGSLEEIGSFMPLPGGIIRMSSFSESRLFRIPLKNLQPSGTESGDRPGTKVLVLPNPHFVEVGFFVLQKNQRHYTNYVFHNSLSFSDIALPMRYPVFSLDPLSAEISEDDYFYLKVRAEHPLSCGVYLVDQRSFMQLYVKTNLYYAGFFGILLSFALAYLFLYTMTDERAYGWALLYQVLLLVLAVSFNKHFQIYFDLSFAAVSGITWSMYGLFHIFMARGIAYRLRHRVWSRKVSKGIFYVQILLVGALLETAFQEDYVWTFTIALIAALLDILGHCIMTVSMILDKERPRTLFFYIAAHIVFYAGLAGLFVGLHHPGLLERSDTLSLAAFFLGPALYACFMFSQTRDRFDKSFALERQAVHAGQLAERDALTGLFNKGYLEYALREKIKDALLLDKTFACIMIDIDQFGDFSRTWGEREGDRVLGLVAGAIQESLRGQDMAARYRGDKFCVILQGAGRAIAQIVAERIREGCKKQFLDLGEGKGLTVSLGGALFHTDDTLESLIRRAQEALYRAKRLGGNRTEFQD